MALSPGTRLGPYEISAPIGAGGMGEVYLATDTNLARQVAIKVLPAAVAADVERLARFDREAKALAALNHPHIAQIYGLERVDGTTALVMELVEGPSLAERIAQGALSLDEALHIAKQLADALEAAHERGIIHRDLKPANIKVRPDGTVKVLDFGLAKALETGSAIGSHGSAGLSLSPTITTPAMTHAGVILGTAAYMSPEQARGKAVDTRADIWAFGVVLFEMLSGTRAFDGEDATEVLGAVVRLEPRLDALPAHVPPRIRQVIRACLQKNVKQRLAHIQDVRLALDGAFETTVNQPSDVQSGAVTSPWWRRALPVVVTAVVMAAIAGGAAWTIKPADTRNVVRWEHVLPEGRSFDGSIAAANVLAVSPDGRQFAYNSSGGLFLRSLDRLDDRPIAGASTGIVAPFFSADGRSVGYFDLASRDLRRISVADGTPQSLTTMGRFPFGASWERDGTILYGQADGIWQVSENGGDKRRVIATKSDEVAFGPTRLPGGEWVLFTLGSQQNNEARWDESQIVVQSIASGQRRVLKPRGTDARYVPTGHLVYAQGGVLYATPFDVKRLEETGAPVQVVRGVRRPTTALGSGAAFYGFSANGTLVYLPGSSGDNVSTLAWVDSAGATRTINMPPGEYQHPRLSPDDKWLAVERRNRGVVDIWLFDLSATTAERRLTEGGNNRYPVWSRDGAHLVFQSDREGDRGIFRQRADGAAGAERLTMPAKDVEHIPEDWSPTEDRLAFSVRTGNAVELWIWTLSDRAARRVGTLQSRMLFNAVFSPNGKWIAYSERTTRVGTYVQAVASGTRYQVGKDEDIVHHPLWSRDGTRLFYFPEAADLVSVSIQTEPNVTFGRPEPFTGRLPVNVLPTSLLNHDVARDGRFVTLVAGTGDREAANRIIIVENWFEELKRLVPTR